MRYQTRTVPGFWGLGVGCPIPQMFVVMIGPWRLIWGWTMSEKEKARLQKKIDAARGGDDHADD